MSQESSKLTPAIKFGWAIGELAVATYVGLTVGFLLFYCTQALGISAWLAGIILLIPRLWDAVTDPFMGAISDRTRSRMGRRRPYLLLGSVVLGVSFTAMFMAPVDAPEWQKAAYVLVFYILASTGITIFDVPYSSMSAEMTTDYKERTSLTGYKMMAARIGILATLMGAPVIFGGAGDLAKGFRLVGIGFGVLMFATGLISFILTRNAPRVETPPSPFRLSTELRAIFRNKPFCALWLVFFAQNLAIGIAATTLLYLLTMVMRVDNAYIGLFMAAAAITGILATPLWIVIGRALGKRKAYFIALGVTGVMSLPALFIQHEYYWALFVALLFVGVGDAGNQLMPNAMVPDTVEIDELRTGERREGAIFGAWAFCRKLGMTTGAFVASLLLSVSGFAKGMDAMHQSESALIGIRFTFALAPFLLWIVTAVLLTRFHLTEADHASVKADIAARR